MCHNSINKLLKYILLKQNSEKNEGCAQRKQYWGVQIHHVLGHLDIHLRFYIILQKFKTLTSRNSYMHYHLPCVHVLFAVQVSLLRIFSTTVNFFHQHTVKFCHCPVSVHPKILVHCTIFTNPYQFGCTD